MYTNFVYTWWAHFALYIMFPWCYIREKKNNTNKFNLLWLERCGTPLEKRNRGREGKKCPKDHQYKFSSSRRTQYLEQNWKLTKYIIQHTSASSSIILLCNSWVFSLVSLTAKVLVARSSAFCWQNITQEQNWMLRNNS